MDQTKIGKFIASQRKEHGLTQSQLAERLGITDKPFVKLSYATQQLLRRGQGAGSAKEKNPLNTSQMKNATP